MRSSDAFESPTKIEMSERDRARSSGSDEKRTRRRRGKMRKIGKILLRLPRGPLWPRPVGRRERATREPWRSLTRRRERQQEKERGTERSTATGNSRGKSRAAFLSAQQYLLSCALSLVALRRRLLSRSLLLLLSCRLLLLLSSSRRLVAHTHALSLTLSPTSLHSLPRASLVPACLLGTPLRAACVYAWPCLVLVLVRPRRSSSSSPSPTHSPRRCSCACVRVCGLSFSLHQPTCADASPSPPDLRSPRVRSLRPARVLRSWSHVALRFGSYPPPPSPSPLRRECKR